MSAPVAPAEKSAPSLLTVLCWVGVGLAPLAALILLVADGAGSLRIGAVLAILAVVLIGLSVVLRAESRDGAGGVEELRDEIEQLRYELRSEIVAAAQRGNQALDQVQRTQETIAALHRRLDAAAARMGSTTPAAEEEAGGRSRVPAAEAYHEGRSRHPAAPEPAPAGGGQPSGRDEDDSSRRPQSGTRYGADRSQPGVYGAARTAEPAARPEPRPLGVVRHTETVHVTRHTIVDGGADPADDARYGGYPGRWSPAPEERPGAGVDPGDRHRSGYRETADDRDWAGADHPRPAHGGSWNGGSWSGPADERSWPASPEGPADDRWQPTGRAGRRDERDERDHGAGWASTVQPDGRDRAGAEGWPSPDVPGRTASESAGRADTDDPDGDYWTELRAGNRWASVRDDERGRETRVGERHAAVHAAGAGTEYRVEDRWASVREPRGDHGAPMVAGPGWAAESRPALPAGGVPVPDEWRPPAQRSGQPDWRRAEPEPARHGDEPYGYPPRDDGPRGGARSTDRWR